MGDNHHREVQLHHQAAQQVEQAGLHRHIQPAGRFIHKHQLRMRHQVAGNLQTLLHAAGKGGRQVVDPVGGNLHLFQPLLRGGTNIAVMTCPGRHQPLADIAACRHLAAQAVEWMLMHHAPFGTQQATAVGLAHCIQRTVLVVNFPLLRRQARGDRLQQRGLPGAGFPDNAQHFPRP